MNKTQLRQLVQAGLFDIALTSQVRLLKLLSMSHSWRGAQAAGVCGAAHKPVFSAIRSNLHASTERLQEQGFMLTSNPPIPNSILAALPRTEYLRMLPSLDSVDLAEGMVLCDAGEILQHVYFPGDCVLSLLTTVDQKYVFGVALVGREGMASTSPALGARLSPFRVTVQAGGSAMRMKSSVFVEAFRTNKALSERVLAFVLSLTMQIAQTAACNRFHGIEPRLARWLLMMRDRQSSDHLHMTHEMLSQLLGVRRVGITNAAHALRQRGLIDYSRGAIDISDGKGLQAAACSCYRMLESRHGAEQTTARSSKKTR